MRAHSPSLRTLAGSSAMIPCRDALPHLSPKAMEPTKQTDMMNQNESLVSQAFCNSDRKGLRMELRLKNKQGYV